MTTDALRELIAYHSRRAAEYAQACDGRLAAGLRDSLSLKSHWHARMSFDLTELLEAFATLTHQATTKTEEVCPIPKKN